MATIKSYTDLPQSKTLSKMLLLESADMYYSRQIDFDYFPPDVESFYPTPFYKDGKEEFTYDVPCWSLAALLEEIPEIISFDNDKSNYALEILKEGGLYYLSYGNPLEGDKLNIEPQENFVDACVAMIEKLNELKLL